MLHPLPSSLATAAPQSRWMRRSMTGAWMLGWLGAALTFACSGGENLDADGGAGSGGSDSSAGGGGGGTDGGGGAPSNTGGNGTGGTNITWPTGPIRPTRYRIPDPEVEMTPCALAGNGAISSSEVLLGQTHLTPKDWPFQNVSANRPLTIAVSAAGTGTAPSFEATARLDGEEFTFCLSGPSSLPASRADLSTSTYRGTLPAKWVQPGLEIEVTYGGASETIAVDVKAENGLTVYLVDSQLFGEGTNENLSEDHILEFLARLPGSYLDIGQDPFGVWKPTHLLIGARDDGKTPNGADTAHPAIVVSENPHCSSQDQTNGTCAPHSGYGTMSAVLGTLDTFREANGVSSTSTWYSDLAVELGGGLAGGQRGTGDNTRLVMNHELGHAWGFPHWAAGDVAYPYEGVQRDRGGFGDRWALDQVQGTLLSPLCNSLERQSPMQRADCDLPDGVWFDPFSDYEATRLLRMTLGAAEAINGSVAYSGGTASGATRPFTLPTEGGRPLMVWNEDGPGMSLFAYDETSNEFVPFVDPAWNHVIEAEVPVVLFAGALIRGGDSFVEEPISYVGNVLEKLDPSVPEDYATLYEKRSSDFYWASDLHLRFTLDDGSVITRIYGGEAVLRADGDSARFAFNLPKALGDRVTKLEVLSRPLGHYSTDSRLDESVTAANYYDDAIVLVTWDRD